MADQRVPRTNAPKRKTKRKPAAPKEPTIIAVLTEEERVEYAMRHSIILQRQMEYNDIVQAQDALRDELVEKYGLPQEFDLKLDTGEIAVRPEGVENAENGRV